MLLTCGQMTLLPGCRTHQGVMWNTLLPIFVSGCETPAVWSVGLMIEPWKQVTLLWTPLSEEDQGRQGGSVTLHQRRALERGWVPGSPGDGVSLLEGASGLWLQPATALQAWDPERPHLLFFPPKPADLISV